MQLRTNRVTVTFTHSDGSFAEASQRAVRLMAEGPHKGVLCVERRGRLLPITVTGQNAASCNLASDPVAQGYTEAQAVAPVATLAQLGIVKAPKEPKPAKSASPEAGAMAAYVKAPKVSKRTVQTVAAPSASSLEEAIAAVREHMKGKPLAEAQAILTSLVTVADIKPSKAQRRR